MTPGAAAVSLLGVWMLLPGAGYETSAGALRPRAALEVEGGSRVFDAGGRRLTIAEFSSDRVGAASMVRASLNLGLDYAPRPGLVVRALLPLAVSRMTREARDTGTDAHIATERRTSLALGDLELSVMQRLYADDRGGVGAGLLLSLPTGRAAALVPNGSGLVEAGPRVGGWVRHGPVALGAETTLRLRSGRKPHVWDGSLAVGLVSERLALLAALGGRASLSLGRGAGATRPAQDAGTSLIPDVTEVMAGTAPGASRVEVFVVGAWSCGHCRVGVEVSATLWGRNDLAAFGGRVFWEREVNLPRLGKLGGPSAGKLGGPPAGWLGGDETERHEAGR